VRDGGASSAHHIFPHAEDMSRATIIHFTRSAICLEHFLFGTHLR
jgi:hypothetical protein